jgi:hypothetical protein
MNYKIGDFGYFEFKSDRHIKNQVFKIYGTVTAINCETIEITDSSEPEIKYKPEIKRITKFELVSCKNVNK